MNEHDRRLLAQKFSTGVEIDAEVKRAVKQALLEHKRKKNPVAVWDGEKVIILMPDQILKGLDEAG